MLGTESEIKVERLWARLGEVGRDLGKRLVRKARLSFRNAMRKQHAIIKHTPTHVYALQRITIRMPVLSNLVLYPLALLLEVGRVFVLDEVMVMVQEEQRQRCTSPQRLQSSFQLVVGQSELF